jgi:hypothetical protein
VAMLSRSNVPKLTELAWGQFWCQFVLELGALCRVSMHWAGRLNPRPLSTMPPGALRCTDTRKD